MSVGQRVYAVWLASLAAVPVTYLLAQRLPLSAGWRIAVWIGLWYGAIRVLDRWARCPHCGMRLLKPGFKPDPDKFAYIRCQGCRRRFDGRDGPDPEVADEALAKGDPNLLKVYREGSAEMERLTRAGTDPLVRVAVLAELEADARQWEVELRRTQALGGRHASEEAEFARQTLERIRQEIAELRRLKQSE